MIISRTPLRISFVGGGTDMEYFYKKYQGRVISMPIDKYIYIIVKKRFDEKIVLKYRKTEIVSSTEEIKHELIKACMELVGIKKSVEIISIADIPSEGSGLGSSSAFTVGLLNALFQFKGQSLDQEELARLACMIEIDICKAPIGKQDQYGTSIGGIKKIVFRKNEKVEITKINDKNNLYKNLENKIILVNSNIIRSASEILKMQKENSSTNVDSLKRISGLVDNFESYLNEQNFKGIYSELNKYWSEKQSLVTSSVRKNLEKIYNNYIPEHCYSGKICGAGGGGHFLFFKKENANLKQLNYLNINIDKIGSVIIYNNYN